MNPFPSPSQILEKPYCRASAMASIVSGDTKKKEKKYKLKDLKKLGHQLLSSRAHINNLPLLLTFVNPASPPQHVLESVLSLESFFTPLIPELPSRTSACSNLRDESKKDPEVIYRTWLRSKFDEFVKLMIDIVVSPEAEDTLKEMVLGTIMEFLKLGKGGGFQSAMYYRLIHSIVNSSSASDVSVELLSSNYFKFIDIRYFTYISLEKITKTLEAKNVIDGRNGYADGVDGSGSRSSMERAVHKVHQILMQIPPLEGGGEVTDHEMWSGSGGGVSAASDAPSADGKQVKTEKNDNIVSAASIAKKMRLKFTKAWLSFLRLPLPIEVYKEVLVTLHQAVIPHLSNPIMLCDFLTRSYDIGGVVSVMALSSLFILMTQHGLEYPDFYEKLYALLQPSIFMVKHRAKFFELLDACLKSPLLPAYLAAAFAKKLSRLALSIPPSGSLLVIALIHNLLRRHPSINCLVHREDGDIAAKDQNKVGDEAHRNRNESDSGTDVSKKPGFDHFRYEETNPIKSNAMRSSLWEIDTLKHHYCPPVSRFVLSLENDLTVRAKTTEINMKDFTSASYATIFGDEIRRRVKQVPLAFYKATPSRLFSESDFPGWTFNHEDHAGTDTGIQDEHLLNNEEPSKRQKTECSA